MTTKSTWRRWLRKEDGEEGQSGAVGEAALIWLCAVRHDELLEMNGRPRNG